MRFKLHGPNNTRAVIVCILSLPFVYFTLKGYHVAECVTFLVQCALMLPELRGLKKLFEN